MANKMLIDSTHPEETRVVVLRGNRVEEFDFESAQRKQLRGNIYLAKVTRVEPSLQAAFVDYGGNRHGFLAFSEIHPDYYQIPVADRQALIEEEERAQRAADAEADNRSAGRRPRHRRSSRRDRDEVVRSEVVADAEGATDQATADVTDIEAATTDQFLDQPEQAPRDAEAAEHGPKSTEDLEQAAPADAPEPRAEASTNQPSDQASAQPQEVLSDEQAGEPIEAQGLSDHADSDHADSEHGDSDHAESDRGESDNGDKHDDEHDDGEEEEEIVESVGGSDALEEAQERTPRVRVRQYKIQEVIKRRQVMLVQVVKEERGTKGAALTTYLSLAGRYSVLMPNTARGGGISRKITQATDRKRLKEVAQDLEVPEGMGVILRTAGANRTKPEIKRDFEYLLRLWETVRDLTLRSTAPTLVYEEGSLIKRSIRDLYSKDIDEVIVAGDAGYHEAKDFMRMLMPSHAKNVKPYKETQPVFSRMGIENQLDAMFSPVVQLRSGGYIVLNQTEALVAIDVNSGRATREHHIEDTALKTNMEAAEEVSRQLRLRDLAGLIVIDFIDMDEKRNNRSVERKLKECLKHDRARIQVGRISHFGLLEMSRQRIRTSVFESSTEKCPHCGGTGHLRSVSSLSLQVLRSLEETLIKGATHNLIVRTRSEVAIYVLNHKRAHLRALEERFRITITISADPTVGALQPFVVEKGEQVHTPEAAKALAAAQPTPASFAETELDAEVEAEVYDEYEGDEELEGEAQVAPQAAGERDEASEGGEGRRRKRRRRRRGRGGAEGREGNVFGPETAAEQGAEDAEDVGAEAEGEDEAEPAEPAMADAEGNGEQRDGRRRRRGRRGGRRSRSEREHGREQEPGAASEDAEAKDAEAMPMHERPAPVFEQPQPEFRSEDFEPRAMPPAQPVQPAIEAEPAPVVHSPPPPPAAEEPPPRRSTVREPAPVFGSDAPPPAPSTPPAPPPAPTIEVISSEPAPSDDRPRKSGWWRRRA